MAAQGGSKEGTFCERCFAPLAEGDEVCPDCGAPTAEAPPGVDSPVHRELAQANLLRLRGDLDGSEKALLGVLRRYPNDPLAHEMLGEVCAEKGEMERAVEWYELALDLAPNSIEAQRRLAEARERLQTRDTADTAETLGLPSARPALTWAPLVGAGALVVLAAIVALWPHPAPPRPLQATVVAPATPAPTPSVTLEATTPTTVPTPPPAVGSTGTEEERKLLESLRAQAGSVRVQSASLDPRTQTLVVAFEVAETDDPKSVAVAIGKAALGISPTAMTASLHALRADRLVFAADLPRAAMANPDPLTNLWPAETPTSSTAGGAPAGSAPAGSLPTGSSSTGSSVETGTSSGSAAPSGTGTAGGAASSSPSTTGTSRP